MKVLVACEFSGIVREAFNARAGCHAISCDLLPAEDGRADYHYQGDVRDILNDGWDLMIAHPPCTDLACSGAAWFEKKRKDGRQQKAIDFFMLFTQSPIKRICIENPVGIMSRIWREPDQIVQPYYFGDEFQKTTCLWLKNLPPLAHAAEDDWFMSKTHVGKGKFIRFDSGRKMPEWYAREWGRKDRSSVRSRTFRGMAQAMAEQWGCLSP